MLKVKYIHCFDCNQFVKNIYGTDIRLAKAKGNNGKNNVTKMLIKKYPTGIKNATPKEINTGIQTTAENIYVRTKQYIILDKYICHFETGKCDNNSLSLNVKTILYCKVIT